LTLAEIFRREEVRKKCKRCDGEGAPLWFPGDPASGHDLSEACDICGGRGYVTATVTVTLSRFVKFAGPF
jgi:DnaJ-class molecular chaperone